MTSINLKSYVQRSSFCERETQLVSKAIDRIMVKYHLSWENKVVLAYYIGEYNKKSKYYNIYSIDTPTHFCIGITEKNAA